MNQRILESGTIGGHTYHVVGKYGRYVLYINGAFYVCCPTLEETFSELHRFIRTTENFIVMHLSAEDKERVLNVFTKGE